MIGSNARPRQSILCATISASPAFAAAVRQPGCALQGRVCAILLHRVALRAGAIRERRVGASFRRRGVDSRIRVARDSARGRRRARGDSRKVEAASDRDRSGNGPSSFVVHLFPPQSCLKTALSSRWRPCTLAVVRSTSRGARGALLELGYGLWHLDGVSWSGAAPSSAASDCGCALRFGGRARASLPHRGSRANRCSVCGALDGRRCTTPTCPRYVASVDEARDKRGLPNRLPKLSSVIRTPHGVSDSR